MLFRKKMPRSCRHCAFSTKLDNSRMLCRKHGVVSESYACRKFRYDPFKRIPQKSQALDFTKYNDDDFSL